MLLKDILKLPEGGSEISKLCRERLRQLKDKEITMEEFDKEIAYLSISFGFEDYHFRSFPSVPFQYERYLRLAPEKKNRLRDVIVQDKDVKEYFKEYSHIFAHNNMVKWWLNRLLVIFEKDQERYNIVKERLGI